MVIDTSDSTAFIDLIEGARAGRPSHRSPKLPGFDVPQRVDLLELDQLQQREVWAICSFASSTFILKYAVNSADAPFLPRNGGNTPAA
jgi:hypothetical protein